MNVTLPALNATLPLSRYWTRLVRLTWLLYVLFIAGLYLIGTPLIYAQRLQLCPGSGCVPWQVTVADVQELYAAGLSLPFYALYATAIPLLIPITGFLITTLIVWKRAFDRMALLTALLLGTCTAGSTDVLKALALTFPTLHWPIAILFFVPSAALIPWTAIFPDGHFVPGWSRWLVIPSVAISLLVFFPAGELGKVILTAWWPVIIVITLGLLFYRYHWHADAVQRQQLRWPLYGTAITVFVQLSVILGAILFPELGRQGTPANLLATTFVTLSLILLLLCFGVAMLRYRLLDLGLIINRTLVYTGLTAIIVSLYIFTVGLLSAMFQVRGNFLIALLATGVVTIAFNPLRDRLQRGVNRFMYGERDDPYRVISRLGQRLEAAFDPSEVLPAIVQTVGESLKLPYVAIVLTMDDWRPEAEEQGPNGLVKENRPSLAELQPAVAASYGQPPQPQALIVNLPLIYQNETVGQLFVSPRPGETNLSTADQRLLADLAHQAGAAVFGVRLMTDLRHLTNDLQRSRERLVLAREEERRRLRRDLHDDLAPTLAGLALTATTIGDLIPVDPAKAQSLANGLDKSIRAAVGDIRRLVYDLRPPALDDLGLIPAIKERAAQYSHHRSPAGSLQVIVEADNALPSLPAAVEVAAYRITQEALMNIVRHAQARTCYIRLTHRKPAGQRPLVGENGLWSRGGCRDLFTEALQIEIADDGIGLAEPRASGVGLASMKERAAELGGLCTIERGVKGGTLVSVSLPILKEEQDESTPYPYR